MPRPFISSNRSLVDEGAVATAIGAEMVIKQRSRNFNRVSIGTGQSIARDTRFTRFAAYSVLYVSLLYGLRHILLQKFDLEGAVACNLLNHWVTDFAAIKMY